MNYIENKYQANIAAQKLLKVLPGIIARYYGCNFYFAGSVLNSLNPRDIDVIVEVPDDLFLAMYNAQEGETIETWSNAVDNWDFRSNIWKNWAIDVAKQGKQLTLLCNKQVDFKVEPSSYFQTINKPRLKIDW